MFEFIVENFPPNKMLEDYPSVAPDKLTEKQISYKRSWSHSLSTMKQLLPQTQRNQSKIWLKTENQLQKQQQGMRNGVSRYQVPTELFNLTILYKPHKSRQNFETSLREVYTTTTTKTEKRSKDVFHKFGESRVVERSLSIHLCSKL